MREIPASVQVQGHAKKRGLILRSTCVPSGAIPENRGRHFVKPLFSDMHLPRKTTVPRERRGVTWQMRQ